MSLQVLTYFCGSKAEFLLEFLDVVSDAMNPKPKRKFFSLTCVTMLVFENNWYGRSRSVNLSVELLINSSVMGWFCFFFKEKNQNTIHNPCFLSNHLFCADDYELTEELYPIKRDQFLLGFILKTTFLFLQLISKIVFA